MIAAIDRRTPLKQLNTSATQMQPRRRSARLAFDEEDNAPPAKRGKASESFGDHAGRQQGDKIRVKTSMYDEDDSGFKFTRARSKPNKEIKRVGSRADVKTSNGPNQRASSPLMSQHASEHRSAQRTLQSPHQPMPQRRSQRLSSDKVRDDTESTPLYFKPRRSKKVKAVAPDHGQSPPGSTASLSAGRDAPSQEAQTTKIALPFADTPVIQRNKDMRARGKTQQRRSSSGLRGRRASSLIDSGQSNAIPHVDVGTEDFYKHIEQSLLEPQRMKHLLVWCGTRAIPKKTSRARSDPNEGLAIDSARQIQEEILRDFVAKPELSDWFSRVEIVPTAIVKKANPRNLQNAARLAQLENEIMSLQNEKAQWGRLLDSAAQPTLSSSQHDRTISKPPHQTELGCGFVDGAAAMRSTTRQHVEALVNRIEPRVDHLREGVHRIGQYRLSAEQVAQRVFSHAAETLEHKERQARRVLGSNDLSPRDVLGTLGKILQRQTT